MITILKFCQKKLPKQENRNQMEIALLIAKRKQKASSLE